MYVSILNCQRGAQGSHAGNVRRGGWGIGWGMSVAGRMSHSEYVSFRVLGFVDGGTMEPARGRADKNRAAGSIGARCRYSE